MLLDGLILYADSSYWLLGGVLCAGLLSGFGITPLDAGGIREPGAVDLALTRVRRASLLWLAACFLPVPWIVGFVMCGLYGGDYPDVCRSAVVWRNSLYLAAALPFVTAIAFGWLLSFAIRRYVITTWSSWTRKWRYRVSSDRLSDIRNLAGKIRSKEYDPRKYYDSKSWERIFIGLGADGKPKYIDTETMRNTHMEVIGPTGCGKGVVVGVILDQLIAMNGARGPGNVVIAVMPKQDLWLPHVMERRARAAGCGFRFFDMAKRAKGGGWAPLAAGDMREKRTRLMSMLGMGESGSDADFYKLGEKRILDEVTQREDFGLTDLRDALEREAKENKRVAIRAIDTLSEFIRVDTFSVSAARAGLRTVDVMESDRPEIIYVNSSLTDETILKMTRALILELTQQAMSLRSKGRRKTHVTLFIDELRFLVSEQFDKALATVAMYDMNLIFAYQSATDIEKVGDRNLSGKAISHSVHTNAQIKLIYRVGDEDQARWAASQTGTQYKTVAGREEVQVDKTGSEKWGERLMVEKKEEFFYPENLFKSLPARAGVLIVPGKRAELVFTAHVPVSQTSDFYDDAENMEKRTAAVESESGAHESVAAAQSGEPVDDSCYEIWPAGVEDDSAVDPREDSNGEMEGRSGSGRYKLAEGRKPKVIRVGEEGVPEGVAAMEPEIGADRGRETENGNDGESTDPEREGKRGGRKRGRPHRGVQRGIH